MYLFLVIFSKYRYHTSLFNSCMTKGNLIQKASRHVLKQFMVVFGDHGQQMNDFGDLQWLKFQRWKKKAEVIPQLGGIPESSDNLKTGAARDIANFQRILT